MNRSTVYSSPPRQTPTNSHILQEQLTRSCGSGSGNRNRRRIPEYRNLSVSSRAARKYDEEPWRKRFREQCVDRLNQAREKSFMLRRQIPDESKHTQSSSDLNDEASSDQHSMTEREMYHIIQQEWSRFREQMEREAQEYGPFDESIIEDIGEDFDMQRNECAEWEEYENQLLEDAMLEEELMNMDIDELESSLDCY